jgi:hypothetical protein
MPLAHIYNALVEWLAHAPGIYGAQMKRESAALTSPALRL